MGHDGMKPKGGMKGGDRKSEPTTVSLVDSTGEVFGSLDYYTKTIKAGGPDEET